MRIRTMAIGVAAVLAAAVAEAHVTIQPRESKAGATEHYTMRVPTEGKVATTSVELEVPAGVNVTAIEGPADSYEAKKANNRIVAITWKVNIAPGQSQQLTFTATNPPAGTEIAWKVHQGYEDGTSSDWVEPAGSRRPGPVTKLTAAGQ